MGIDVLLSESNSKREWPAAVAFSHSARLLGAHAAGAASSHAPFSSPKRLLLLGRRRPGAAPPSSIAGAATAPRAPPSPPLSALSDPPLWLACPRVRLWPRDLEGRHGPRRRAMEWSAACSIPTQCMMRRRPDPTDSPCRRGHPDSMDWSFPSSSRDAAQVLLARQGPLLLVRPVLAAQ
ncbi:hypothetical protein ZWY2020_053733 [Hordeum vulgare]|nr:hypothetical protein ZWY2020_053733 [Hordeum vulgare]